MSTSKYTGITGASSALELAGFLLQLYDSRHVLGIVDAETFAFQLKDPVFPYSGNAANNQKVAQ